MSHGLRADEAGVHLLEEVALDADTHFKISWKTAKRFLLMVQQPRHRPFLFPLKVMISLLLFQLLLLRKTHL